MLKRKVFRHRLMEAELTFQIVEHIALESFLVCKDRNLFYQIGTLFCEHINSYLYFLLDNLDVIGIKFKAYKVAPPTTGGASCCATTHKRIKNYPPPWDILRGCKGE